MRVDSPVGSRLGVIGGGQLGRMMAEAATPLGVELVVLDPTPQAPASAPAHDQIVASFDDREAIAELANRTDALTFEIELADPDVLSAVATASSTPVHPSPETLRTIQDKLVQKRALDDAGIPIPPFASINSAEDLERAGERLGYPLMLKSRQGGYDGRGNVPVTAASEIPTALESIDTPAMAEGFIDFAREIAVIAVQGRQSRALYTPTETIHEEEILRESLTPARTSQAARTDALHVAETVLDQLHGRGVYGIELFETNDGEILVNEIAPRPHNSGHWTIEGAMTSQFEQHVRAVLGLPLGSTTVRGPIVTANLLGDVDEPADAYPQGIGDLLADPHVKLHWYGKEEVRPLRKMGHLAVHDPEGMPVDQLLETARTYAGRVTFRTNEV